MERLRCISCGGYVVIGDGSVSFPCPACGEMIGRCSRCRRIGKRYACSCGFEGP